MNSYVEFVLRHPLVESLSWTVVHFFWQALVVALPFGLAMHLLRRSLAQARYVVACVGLLTLAVVPLLTFCLLVQASDPIHWQMVNRKDKDVALTSPHDAFRWDALPETTMEWNHLKRAESVANDPQVDVRPGNVTSRAYSVLIDWWKFLDPARWTPVVAVAWFAGVIVLSCRLLGGLWQVSRLRRRSCAVEDSHLLSLIDKVAKRIGVRWPIELLQSDETDAPTVIGFLRPALIVPLAMVSGLTTAEVESILAHELAHIRRRDWIVNVVQSIIETLLFFHPVVWWVGSVIRFERENCCDDEAIAVCGNRLALARALAHLEETRCDMTGLAMSASGGELIFRIRRILFPHQDIESARCTAGLLALSASLLIVCGLWVSILVPASGAGGVDDRMAVTSVAAEAADTGVGEGKMIVSQSGHPSAAIPESSGVGKMLATHTYDLTRRESTEWVFVNDTRVPVDVGVEYQGVRVYLTLMFDVVAIDVETGELLWKRKWVKSSPIWSTVSILQSDRSSDAEPIVELQSSTSNEDNPAERLYLMLRTGKEIVLEARSQEPVNQHESNVESPEQPLVRQQELFHKEPDRTPWGPVAEESGLQLRLILQTEEPQVGQPLLVRLELRNAGKQSAVFDPQYYAPFRVLRVHVAAPDSPPPFIGLRPQTFGQKETLPPGESRTLWEHIDVSQLFLLAHAREYEISARGGHRTQSPLSPESNLLSIKLQPGSLPAKQKLIAALARVLPEDWTVIVGVDAIHLQQSPTNLKQDAISLAIRIRKDALIDDQEIIWQFSNREDGSAGRAASISMGKTELGYVYIVGIPQELEQVWPSYLESIKEAIESIQDKTESDQP